MQELPQNGIRGMKHWRYDLMAGMQVALVSLPLSIGIAIASGAPPITGLISAIIAGLIFPFLGGAYVTISGPAAGLAPALLSGMLLLGNGDLVAGYPLLLVAICLTGLVQIFLALFKAGRFAIFLPVTVVEAMLAAIGLIIIIKQIPPLMGAFLPASKSMLLSIAKLPQAVLQIEWAIFLIGALSLFLMFYLNRTRHQWMRKMPPPLLVALLGIAFSYVFNLDPKYLITMPEDLLKGGITFPAFSEVFSRSELWWNIMVVVVTLTLIDGIESLATIKAVDKIDPYQRKSDPNITLRAMGVSNSLSSIFGGLTIIPGGIKSRVNIDAGGRTLWANFYNAIFLIIFLFMAKDIISRVPLAAIAAILVYVGWRLCEYKLFIKTYTIGRDQIVIFVITILAILATDLLWGIIIGVVAEVMMLLYLLGPSLRYALNGRLSFKHFFELLWVNLRGMFRSPIIKIRKYVREERFHYEISLGTTVCFNLLPLDKILEALPDGAGVTLVVTGSGKIIDHTSMEYLHQFQEECLRDGRVLEIQGMENFIPFSSHSLSARMRDTKLIKEKSELSARQRQMESLANECGLSFSPETVSILKKQHDFVFLRRGADTQETNVMSGNFHGCEVKLSDYSYTAAPDYFDKHWHTLIRLCCATCDGDAIPDFVITPGHFLERYLVEFHEIDITGHEEFSRHYRLYMREKDGVVPFITHELIDFLLKHPDFYMEVRDGTMLAFRAYQENANMEEISYLLELAEMFHPSCALPSSLPCEECDETWAGHNNDSHDKAEDKHA